MPEDIKTELEELSQPETKTDTQVVEVINDITAEVVETPKVDGRTIVERLEDMCNQVAASKLELDIVKAQNDNLKNIEAAKKAMETELSKAKAELEQKTKELAEMTEKVAKLEDIINLSAYKDVTEGANAVKDGTIGGPTLTIIEQYKALKGDEQFKFYQEHKQEILNELGK